MLPSLGDSIVDCMLPPRIYRAGQAVEDYCRACHEDRSHTIIVVNGAGSPLRVQCGFCGSEHNFRGGPRTGADAATSTARTGRGGAADAPTARPSPPPSRPAEPIPLVSERERRTTVVAHDASSADLELLIRRIIREESGLTPVTPADKWRGGDLVLRPGKPGLQEKTLPIDTFFHKIVMLRNRLRTLEQQLNASDLPADAKVKLQSYITGCYGSLTSFNVLFADEDDKFVGTSQD